MALFDVAVLDHVAVVGGEHDDTAGVVGGVGEVAQRRHGAQAPVDVDLVAAVEAVVDGVDDGADDAALGVGDRRLHVRGEAAVAEVALVEQQRRQPRP